MKRILITAAIAIAAYIGVFVLLILVNSLAASGFTDEEYGRSAALAGMNLLSKALLAVTVGAIAGARLPKFAALGLTLALMGTILVLAHILPAGGFLFAIYAGDPLWLQSVVIVMAIAATLVAATLVQSRRASTA